MPLCLPINNREAFQTGNKKSCQLRQNEETIGIKLLKVENVDGLTGIVATRSNTPEGLMRHELFERLFPMTPETLNFN
jgi:hypothetical protein